MRFLEVVWKGFVTVEHWTDNVVHFPLVVVRASDSIAGLLYDRVNDRVLLVRQCRAAMVRDNNPTGQIVELVAGRFDVNLDPRSLLVKEAWEEAGVTIKVDDVVLLNGGQPLALSTGVLTERSYLAFAEIRSEQMVPGEVFGAPEEGEMITRFWMPAEDFISANHEDLRVWALAQFLAKHRTKRSWWRRLFRGR
jgi:8-oxo-dGTP pyrophosphatase MutT (NUDIX family)